MTIEEMLRFLLTENIMVDLRGTLYKNVYPGDVAFELTFNIKCCCHIKGFVPLDVAIELYESTYGKEIHVGGDSSAPDPRSPGYWMRYLDTYGTELIPLKFKPDQEYLEQQNVRYVDSPEEEGKPYIRFYRIYTVEALQFFIQTLRKHKLIV